MLTETEPVSAKATGNSLVPLDTLGGTIKAHIAAGDKATGKAEEHYKAAGIHLGEAKERVAHTKGLTWSAFCIKNCSIGRRRADELIAIAEGRTSLVEIRAGYAKANAKRNTGHVHARSAENPEQDQDESSRSPAWASTDPFAACLAIVVEIMKGATLADWTKLARCASDMKSARVDQWIADQAERPAPAKPAPKKLPPDEPATAAPVHNEPRSVNTYFHLFEHGTCHLLPKTDDYESPAWVQWRADHPGWWKWRPRTLDAKGALLRDAEGRYIKPGPWLNPDGTKHRSINAASMTRH